MKKILSLIAVLIIGLTGCADASTQFDDVLSSIADKSASYTYTTNWYDGTKSVYTYDADSDTVTGEYSYGGETINFEATGEEITSASYNGTALSDDEIDSYLLDGTFFTSDGLKDLMTTDVSYIQSAFSMEYDTDVTETDTTIEASGVFEGYDGTFEASITNEAPYTITFSDLSSVGYDDTIVFE